MKLRPLAKTVRANNRDMVQLWRQNDVAIYRDSRTDASVGDAGYEVIIIRNSKPHPRDPNPENFDLIECYPPTSHWGSLGWTFTAKSHADPLATAKQFVAKLSGNGNACHATFAVVSSNMRN
jgi:hypothetical protein